MPIDQNISAALSASLSGLSHNITMLDADGKGTLQGKNVVYLYLKDKNIMVFINHKNTDVEIWFDPETVDKSYIGNTIKPYVVGVARKYLYGVSVKSYGGSIEPKQFTHRTAVSESRNTTKTSYHPLGETRIIIRHSKAVTEEKPGARSRNIDDIFIEHRGERFRYPHKHLMGARAMALHVDQGGKPWDETGEKIIELSRRRKEIMELLRWSSRLESTSQLEEIKSRGKTEVNMIKRMLERAARNGNLDAVIEYRLPARRPVTENELDIITKRHLRVSAIPGLELVHPQGLVTEVIANLTKKLI